MNKILTYVKRCVNCGKTIKIKNARCCPYCGGTLIIVAVVVKK